jgi:hypothetical protein
MTLLRRAPREVYRVYSEEEYLDGAGSELGAGLERASAGERDFHRAAGVAMLVGVTGIVGAIVVLNSAWAHTSAGGGPEKLMAAARPRVMRSPLTASQVAPSRAVVVRPSETTHPPVRRTWHHHGGSGLHPPIHRSTRLRGSVAIVVDYVPVPRSSPAGPAAADAPVGSSAASAPAEAPSAPPEKRPEFGFER